MIKRSYVIQDPTKLLLEFLLNYKLQHSNTWESSAETIYYKKAISHWNQS